jgi:adhesin/invasin
MVMSIFGSNLAGGTESAPSVPLPGQMQGTSVTINGFTAPLYYVSPSQLNVQIPYETLTFSNATVTVSANGQRISRTIQVSASAPGIFVDQNGAAVPGTRGARGSVVTLFITGAGAISPPVQTGGAPPAGTPTSQLPQPSQSVRVTVGGVTAPVQFIGITPGLVGVMQINYQIPTGIATGNRPVVVSIGGVASASATLTVQ